MSEEVLADNYIVKEAGRFKDGHCSSLLALPDFL